MIYPLHVQSIGGKDARAAEEVSKSMSSPHPASPSVRPNPFIFQSSTMVKFLKRNSSIHPSICITNQSPLSFSLSLSRYLSSRVPLSMLPHSLCVLSRISARRSSQCSHHHPLSSITPPTRSRPLLTLPPTITPTHPHTHTPTHHHHSRQGRYCFVRQVRRQESRDREAIRRGYQGAPVRPRYPSRY